MKWLMQGFFNLRWKHKVALLCAALVVASTGISGILLYRNAAQVTTEAEAVHSSNVILQVNNYLTEKLKGIITRSLAMRTDSVFNETATQFLINEDPRYYASALSYFSSVFLEMRYSEPFISSVYLYTPKSSFYDLSLPHDTGLDFTNTAMFRSIASQPDSSVYWLPHAESELYRDNGKVIPLVLRFSISGYSEELYMVINLKESMILQYLRDSQTEGGGTIFILDNQTGEVVVGNSPIIPSMLEDASVRNLLLYDESGRTEIRRGQDAYTVNYIRTSLAPWTLVNVQSQLALLDKLQNMKTYSVLILLISITVSFCVAYLLSVTISRPIQRLEKTMQRVRLRKFDVRFEYPYEDEVGKLGRTFNFMTAEIHDLISRQSRYIEQLQEEKERSQQEQRLKRIAELKALQSQMSPHFLYNTLDTIKWTAEREGKPEIANMITALASFYRIALSRGKEIITVKEELAHVESYLAIQKMRDQNQFAYSLHVDPHIESKLTVKFILQPLVENAIYHGIKQREAPGVIEVRAESDNGGIRFTVRDNGPGIHPVKLQVIRNRLRKVQVALEDGFGLYNVNNRIKYYYGDACGLEISSSPGEGALVTAWIPQTLESEATSDV